MVQSARPRKEDIVKAMLRLLIGIIVFGAFCAVSKELTGVTIHRNDYAEIIIMGTLNTMLFGKRSWMTGFVLTAIILGIVACKIFLVPAAFWIAIPATVAGLLATIVVHYPSRRPQRREDPISL